MTLFGVPDEEEVIGITDDVIDVFGVVSETLKEKGEEEEEEVAVKVGQDITLICCCSSHHFAWWPW